MHHDENGYYSTILRAGSGARLERERPKESLERAKEATDLV